MIVGLWFVSFTVPADVGRRLTGAVAVEITRMFGDQLGYPQLIMVDPRERPR